MKNIALLPASELALPSVTQKLNCTGLKVDNLSYCWAYIVVFGLILKWKSHAVQQQEDILTFIARFFLIRCKKFTKLPKFRKKFT